MVLLDLIKKGHSEPDKKIGEGSKPSKLEPTPCGKAGASFLLGKTTPQTISASGSALIRSSLA
ncbi:hypothetical protein Bca52824_039939 [Brassica carinata]|uniref:Uncharacterized protein n=1 Tax=Brassica carinata TaxID=52824 RepID=A0A8X7RS42_BRACI|nr:hypothetical protein Bca52824_039939 [Brassica carinata]